MHFNTNTNTNICVVEEVTKIQVEIPRKCQIARNRLESHISYLDYSFGDFQQYLLQEW